MKTKIIILFMLCLLSCKNSDENKEIPIENRVSEMPFDKEKWSTKDGIDYPYRESMLQNLLDNAPLKGSAKTEVIELLGQPDRIDNGYLFYKIAQQRLQFFPLHTKTMVIKLDENGKVKSVKIHQ